MGIYGILGNMKLLFHACCAPCSTGCLAALGEEGIEPVLYWYNPNIHPYTEYRARRDCLRRVAKEKELQVMEEDEYDLRGFLEGVYKANEGFQGDAGSGRCVFCYRLRLEKAAAFAAANNFEAFSTSLLISPYQDHRILKTAGEEFGAKYGVAFYYQDFRPHFHESQRIARDGDFYMQKYCGCVFSEEERYR
jgi:predicted adenine nucleotide alpha hydrolase (AANH) superfamily ATPase